jgi:hypothetical protein
VRPSRRSWTGAAWQWAGLATAVSACTAILLPLAAPRSGAAEGGPEIGISTPVATASEQMSVAGENSQPVTGVWAQICGENAQNPVSDCAKTIDRGATTAPTAAIAINGAATTPPKTDAIATTSGLQSLRVVNAYLKGTGPWTSWFGAPPQRTLVLTVHNPNATPYVDPLLLVHVGPTANTTTFTDWTLHHVATIGAAQTKVYDVAVSFPAFSIGEHQVQAAIGRSTLSRTVTVQTWLFPWGLLAVVLIVIEVLLVLLTRAIRERRRTREEREQEGREAGREGERDEETNRARAHVERE